MTRVIQTNIKKKLKTEEVHNAINMVNHYCYQLNCVYKGNVYKLFTFFLIISFSNYN
jgi:hypothetical protein